MTGTTKYTPFSVELGDLKPSDLAVLRSVKEGWYVEYKQELPNAKSIAKSISSFANTYGGWIFYGIVEKSKDDSVAGEFVGIDEDSIDKSLQSIRQSIAACLSSAPVIELKAVYGPGDEIGLPKCKAIICINIPMSLTAPHIHLSGQIYRRVADGSEPKPENDRHLLDQLWERSREFKNDMKDWIGHRDPELLDIETNIPYLRLMIIPDPWLQKGHWSDLSLKEARTLFNRDTAILSNSPYNSVHQNHNGFIARQTSGNDPSRLTATWVFRRNIVNEVYLPLSSHKGNPDYIRSQLSGYRYKDRFYKVLLNQGHRKSVIIDLNILFNFVCSIAEQMEVILDRHDVSDNYYIKARILNVHRSMPFLDTDYFISDCENNGLPICLDGVITSPPGLSPDSFESISRSKDQGNVFENLYNISMQIFYPIAEALGIPVFIEEGDSIDFAEISEAGKRAMENQKIRIERQ